MSVGEEEGGRDARGSCVYGVFKLVMTVAMVTISKNILLGEAVARSPGSALIRCVGRVRGGRCRMVCAVVSSSRGICLAGRRCVRQGSGVCRKVRIDSVGVDRVTIGRGGTSAIALSCRASYGAVTKAVRFSGVTRLGGAGRKCGLM